MLYGEKTDHERRDDMNKTFFIADTHFGENNIRRYENRPFESAEEMDALLIKNWNSVVSSDDEVYVLGDFGADKKEAEVLADLNGIKYLVKGNHDVYSNEYYSTQHFFVSVERINYTPISFDEIVQKVKEASNG